jgi:hypothetical protein
MKTKYWVILLGVLLAVSLGLGLWLLAPGEDAAAAEIWSDGELLYTLDLRVDQTKTVVSENGANVITVKDGKIAVTEADCPDQYCVRQGFCNSGKQIVCLPHKLVISFLGESEIDGAVG